MDKNFHVVVTCVKCGKNINEFLAMNTMFSRVNSPQIRKEFFRLKFLYCIPCSIETELESDSIDTKLSKAFYDMEEWKKIVKCLREGEKLEDHIRFL